ncbi:MAG: hypothetical protein RL760_388 [Candidatus Eisenbacteria bacterium]|jgi:hypothetical protein
MKYLIAVLASVATVVHADTLVFTPSADNTIIEDPAGVYSCGMAQYFFAGRVGVNGGSTLRRGALKFNLAAIPAGSTVTSVSLRMSCTAAGTTSPQTIMLKRMLASWGEGPSQAFGGGGTIAQAPDCTWLHRFFPNTSWSTPGGDFSSTVSVSRSVSTMGTYTWTSTPQFVADVQSMVRNPAGNFGWCVQGNEVTLQSVKRFDSREAAAATRPELTVVFTPSGLYDLNGDTKVNAADLAIMLAAWGTVGPGDFNGDGTVGATDLGMLLASWAP